jgi:hypothetical protein
MNVLQVSVQLMFKYKLLVLRMVARFFGGLDV